MKEASQPFVKLRSTGAPATGHLDAQKKTAVKFSEPFSS